MVLASIVMYGLQACALGDDLLTKHAKSLSVQNIVAVAVISKRLD